MKDNIFALPVWIAGRILSFGIAALLLAAWAVTGPLFHLNDLYRERFNKKAKGIL